MRRALVGENRRALAVARGLALQQHVEPPCKPRDLGFLPGDDLRKIIDGAGEMRDMFLA